MLDSDVSDDVFRVTLAVMVANENGVSAVRSRIRSGRHLASQVVLSLSCCQVWSRQPALELLSSGCHARLGPLDEYPFETEESTAKYTP